ncbi:MAG: ABC transporter permease subunit [Anaerolineales bacterium]|nr:ABC transporter permease subunit [Anaerolineales bacterium]
MKNIWTIANKEYNAYFNSPLGYIVMLIIFAIVGLIFAISLLSTLQNPFFAQALDPTLVAGPLLFMMLFCTPALTMRLISDEARTGTLELLLTAPIRDWELVIGKWFGAFLFVLTVIASTLVFPIMIHSMTEPGIDVATTAASYLGMIFVTGAFLGLGVGISAIFNNQFAAFFATLGLLVVLWWLVGAPANFIPAASNFFNYLDMNSHYYSGFYRGVVKLTDIVYYVSVAALGLFTANIAIEFRRWK